MYLEEYFDTLVELDEDIILESIFNKEGYEKYKKKMKLKGKQPLSFEKWKKRNIMIASGAGGGIIGLGTAAAVTGVNTYKNVKTGQNIYEKAYEQEGDEFAKPSFKEKYKTGRFTRKAAKGIYKAVPKEVRKDLKDEYKKTGVYL